MNDNDSIEGALDQFRDDQNELAARKANDVANFATFVLDDTKLKLYKELLRNEMPPELIMNDKQYTLMNYWEKKEIERNTKVQASLKEIFKVDNVLNQPTIQDWRKGYLQDLIKQSKKFNELNKQLKTIPKTLVLITDEYGITEENNPLVNPRIEALRMAIEGIFGRSENGRYFPPSPKK